MRSLLVVVTVLLASGCSSASDPAPRADPAPSPRPSASSADPAPASPSASSSTSAGAGVDEVCTEVVAGISAFNLGDFDETVAHFEAAVPLAEAADDGSAAAGDLLDAVRYYAALPPEDYLDAAAGSAEFARWKAVTLGQCAGAGVEPPGSPEDTETPGEQA